MPISLIRKPQFYPYTEGDFMDNLTFGVTMMVTGMGGTLVVLSLFAIIMNILKMIFPLRKESTKSTTPQQADGV